MTSPGFSSGRPAPGPSVSPAVGTPGRRRRSVDATRGLALLGSATATAVLWLDGRQLGTGYRPLDGSDADRAVDLLTALLVDNRVLAVFALLLGHGVAVRLQRAQLRGDDPDASARAVLRRVVALVLLGAVHAALVLETDVLATLGVLLLLGLPLARARTRTHVVVGLLVLPALLVHGVADGLGGTAGFPDPPTDYLLSVLDRVGTWLLALVLLPFTQVGLLLAVIAGIRLARSGWLLTPGEHRRGLLLLGAASTLVGLAGALPYARVVSAGAEADIAVAVPAGASSSLTGPAGALGAVCLSVLLLDAAGRAAGRASSGPVSDGRRAAGRTAPALRLVLAVGDGLARLGRHSLPVYLVHSVVLAAVLAPWAGGAGTRWGSAAVCALAAGVWLVTLVLMTAVRPRAPGGAGQPNERQGLARSSAT